MSPERDIWAASQPPTPHAVQPLGPSSEDTGRPGHSGHSGLEWILVWCSWVCLGIWVSVSYLFCFLCLRAGILNLVFDNSQGFLICFYRNGFAE